MGEILEVLTPWPPGASGPGAMLTPAFVAVIWLLALLAVLRQGRVGLATRVLAKLTGELSEKWRGRHLSSPGDVMTIASALPEQLRALKHPLEEFGETLYLRRGVLFNVHQVEEFVSPDGFRDAVYSSETRLLRWMSPALVAAIPNLLTAIGILGTFVGLVIGLGQAMKYDASNPDVAALVDGLQLSFRTSVWGLLLSLIVTWRNRQLSGRIRSAVLDFVEFFNHRLKRGTQQELLVMLLEDQSEATGALKTLKTDIAEGLVHAIRSELRPSIERLTDSSVNTQAAGVDRLITAILENIGGELQAAGQSMREAGERWGALVVEMEALTTQQSALAATLTQALGPAAQFSKELGAAATQMSPAAQAFTGAAAHFRAASREGQEVLTSVRAAAQEELVLLQAMREGLDGYAEQWSLMAKELEGLSEALGDGLTTFADRFGPAIEVTMKDFDRELARVGQHLAQGAGQLRDAFEDLDDRIQAVLAPEAP